MAASNAWRARLQEIAASPMTYVLAFAVLGAALVVAGVGVIAGAGCAMLAAGGFLLAGSNYITRGMKKHV